jgi:hypothetical protein
MIRTGRFLILNTASFPYEILRNVLLAPYAKSVSLTCLLTAQVKQIECEC